MLGGLLVRVAVVVVVLVLLLQPVQRFSLYSCLCLLPLPNRLLGCGGYWMGLGSCILGVVVAWVGIPFPIRSRWLFGSCAC